MNVVLIGYRGTGKSTIGRLVAAELDLVYVGLDDQIVHRAGMSIPEIVNRYSWDHFRALEQEVVDACAAGDGQVLDTGGGVVTRAANVAKLRLSGVVFLLEATIDDIVQRIGGGSERPSLTGSKSFTDEVTEVLRARTELYRAAADHIIDTSSLPPPAAAAKIAQLYRAASGARGERGA